MAEGERKLEFVASSEKDLKKLPFEVQQVFAQSLELAKIGEKHIDAKPMKGFKGASVLEVVEDHMGDTYRAMYTVRFEKAVYVLHVFKKKSKSGIKTPKQDIELVERRLKAAEEHYKQKYLSKKNERRKN